MYHHPQRSKQIVISGFKKSHITEAVREGKLTNVKTHSLKFLWLPTENFFD